MKNRVLIISVVAVLLLALTPLAAMAAPGRTNFSWLIAKQFTV